MKTREKVGTILICAALIATFVNILVSAGLAPVWALVMFATLLGVCAWTIQILDRNNK